jgi:hypothetical protein
LYSEKIILRNLDEFAAREGWMPTYHTYDEVCEFSAYLNTLIEMESNSKSSYIKVIKPITQRRQKEIARFIENEQALCGLDSSYWEKNFAWVCDEKGQIFKFKNRKSQDVFDAIVADFDEKQVSIELMIIKARQVGMCLDPDTKVLTADLKWVRISDLEVGEEVVAVDEGLTLEEFKAVGIKNWRNRVQGIKSERPRCNVNKERKMRTAVVEAKWDVTSPAIRLTFEDGRQLTATPEHKFLIKQHGGSQPRWQVTKKIGVGDELRYVTTPWPEMNLEDAWIGGVIDGEGSLNTKKDGIELKITQAFNKVLDRLRDYMLAQHYSFQEAIDCRQPDPERPSKLGKKDVWRIAIARMNEVFRLIGKTQPVRFVGSHWWNGKCMPGKKSGMAWQRIVKIELLPAQRMVDIQTSTKTFIAEGFVSHNSTKVALKFVQRLMFIPHTQAVMASVQKEKSELIGRILDTAYNRCPWWLVPRRLPKRSFDNGSILSIQSGMQATGLAQGWTPTCIHVCLDPETLIHVQDGKVKQIRDVQPGDMVLTSKCRLAKVKGVVKSSRVNEVACEIWLWGNYDPLVVTRDHPILTPDGFEHAESINDHDYVVMPIRPIEKTITTSKLFHHSHRISKNKGPAEQVINLTREWGWMCGLYLAEGSSHRNTRIGKEHWDATYFCIHHKEIENCMHGLHAALGADQHIRVRTKSGTQSTTLAVSNAALTRWFVENFGHLADGKRIPDWVFSAGEDFVAGLLKGYFEGDGYIPEALPIITGSSISFPLTIQLRDLLASSGFGWAAIYFDAGGVRYGRNCRDRWQFKVNGDYARKFRLAMGWGAAEKVAKIFSLDHPNCSSAPKHWKYSPDGKAIWIEVYNNRPVNGGEFYDLEVDAPEHDFCTIHCCVKNSELADIPDPRRVIEEGLFRAAHSSRNLFMVLEGTGGGNTGWLADTWRSSKEDFPKGLARLCPVFIPWAMCPDIYPEDDWIRKFPVPGGFKPHDTTRKHVIKCESYIRNTPYLARIAGRDWRMPIEQQWFWQFNYDAACKNHTQKTWSAQMPADDFEALTGVHDSVFDPEVLMGVEDSIYEIKSDNTRIRKTPVQAYAITGHDVDDVFYPADDQIDWTKDCVRVEWDSHRGQHYEWTMIPVLMGDENKERHTMDYLLVYEMPRKGNLYAAAIDTADGLGKEDEERTCLSVAKNRFNGQSDQQVAELTSNRINSAQIVAFAACVGALYGPSCPDSRGVKFVIEQIQGPGDTCQHQLKMMGFFNQHVPRRYDNKKIKDDSGRKEGWYSNAWSVPMLMTRFVEAVNGGWYEPRSMWLIEELRTLERHETSGKSKMVHRQGKFDDRVRAAAMSYFTAHDFDVLTDRAQKRYAPPTKKQVVSKERCTTSQISVGW